MCAALACESCICRLAWADLRLKSYRAGAVLGESVDEHSANCGSDHMTELCIGSAIVPVP